MGAVRCMLRIYCIHRYILGSEWSAELCGTFAVTSASRNSSVHAIMPRTHIPYLLRMYTDRLVIGNHLFTTFVLRCYSIFQLRFHRKLHLIECRPVRFICVCRVLPPFHVQDIFGMWLKMANLIFHRIANINSTAIFCRRTFFAPHNWREQSSHLAEFYLLQSIIEFQISLPPLTLFGKIGDRVVSTVKCLMED